MNLLLIIGFIYLISINSSLKKEITKLKDNSNKSTNFCPNCGFNLSENRNSDVCDCNNYCENAYQDSSNLNISEVSMQNVICDKEVCEQDISVINKVSFNKDQVKNNLILISGSFLIILSAIVFLTSTWNITHNMFKIFVILLMLGVFLGASFVADKIFKLKQTSNAFYYIALAYIPIFLLSIAYFSLFGKYLSLYGLGRYIYLTISSFIVSSIYYYNAKKKDSYLIAIFSMIFSLLGVLFFGLILNSSSYIAIIMVFIYNLVLLVSYKYKKYFYKEEFHFKVINVLIIALSSVGILNVLDDLSYKVIIYDIILEILMLYNLYYLLIKINNKNNIYNYIYPILTIIIAYTIASLISNDFVMRQLFILISFIVIYLYEYLKKNEISIISYFEVLACLIIIVFSTIINIDIFNYDLGIKSYIILGIFLLLNIFNYLVTNKYKLIQAFTLTITFITSILSVLINMEASSISIITSYTALILIFISLFKLDKNLKCSFSNIGHITIILFTLVNLFSDNNIALLILYNLYTLICYYQSTLNNKDICKINSYIYFNISISYLCSLLNINYTYAVPFTTIVISLLEYFKPKLKTDISNVYLILSYSLSFCVLLNYSIINFSLFIIMMMLFIIYIYYYKRSSNYLYIPLLLIIPYIYDSNVLYFNNFNYMYIVSIFSMIGLISCIYYCSKNIYIILFYIYILFHISNLEEIKYISLIVLTLGTFVSYLRKENIVKDRFKFVLYLCIFILYLFIVNDLHLSDVTVLTVGSYLILLLISTRTILKKYTYSYKRFEYTLSSLINLIALVNYTSEMDGIIYVMYLTLLVIISYIYKYGPIFIVSLIFILLNVIILTRTFWFSIPWWFYILLVGSILVEFAIYNEIKEKKDNKVKDKMESLKNSLDL